MKKIGIVLMIGIFAVIGFGQSGRRIEPLPTPSPQVADEPTYSETLPNPNKPLRVYPARTRESQATQKSKTAPVLQPANGTATQKDPLEEGEVETIGTNLVTIPVAVFDRHGMYIPNLEQKNFRIFEDGEEQ